jgi:WD40 repeat protein
MLRDAATGNCNAALQGTDTLSVAISPDRKIVSDMYSGDSTLKLWDAANGNCDAMLHGHSDATCSADIRASPAITLSLVIAISPDSKEIASVRSSRPCGDRQLPQWTLALYSYRQPGR